MWLCIMLSLNLNSNKTIVCKTHLGSTKLKRLVSTVAREDIWFTEEEKKPSYYWEDIKLIFIFFPDKSQVALGNSISV